MMSIFNITMLSQKGVIITSITPNSTAFEQGFKAALKTIDRLDKEKFSEDEEMFLGAIMSKMHHLEKKVKPLAESAARNTVRDYLKKKAMGK